jgi:asparagine synthase (glutamine-hydrolysing)
LLSGGLDSSLIASLVCRHASERIGDESGSAWYPRVHTFSVGLKGSPDLVAARKVADYLKTVHHECVFDVQQALDAIRDVIYHVETYDVTTIRASTPLYLLCRLVKAYGIKMLLSGEGADEAFAGYLYFHHAPTDAELQAECRRKLIRLSRFDCLRANQASAAFGVEVRVPFLDRAVLCEAMSFHPSAKMVRPGSIDRDGIDYADRRKIEKYSIRRAFADVQPPLLPDEVLWRPKEQFSDGVGYAWIDALKEHAENEITDQQMSNAKFLYPHNTPTNKEAFLYRKWYEELFPSLSAAYLIPGGASIACSTETAVRWRKEWAGRADPSGRAVADVHPNAF